MSPPWEVHATSTVLAHYSTFLMCAVKLKWITGRKSFTNGAHVKNNRKAAATGLTPPSTPVPDILLALGQQFLWSSPGPTARPGWRAESRENSTPLGSQQRTKPRSLANFCQGMSDLPEGQSIYSKGKRKWILGIPRWGSGKQITLLKEIPIRKYCKEHI